MAESNNKPSGMLVSDDLLDASSIIKSIESTSQNELEVLLRIEKNMAGKQSASSSSASQTTKRQKGNNQRRQKEQQAPPARAARNLPPEIKDDTTIVRKKTHRPLKASTAPHTQNNPKDADKPRVTTQPDQSVPVSNAAQRDKGGRFVSSADKAQESKADARHKEVMNEGKKSRGIFQQVGDLIKKADPKGVEGTAVDAAGVAAGGTFWKAGKDAVELVKNTAQMLKIGSGNDEEAKRRPLIGKVKKLFSRKATTPIAVGPESPTKTPAAGIGTGRNTPAIISANSTATGARGLGLKRAAGARATATSLDVANRNIQKSVVDKTEQQTLAIKEGDQQIIEKLDDLLKQKNGKGGGGLGGMLGKALSLAATMWVSKHGKRLLASILAGLGLKAFKNMLGDGPKGRGPRDIPGQDGSSSQTDGPNKNNKKKKTKGKKTSNPKGKGGWLKNVLKKSVKPAAAAVGTAAAATTAYAVTHKTPDVDAVTEPDTQKAETTKNQSKTPKSGADAARESAEKTRTSAPKTGEKISIGRPLTPEDHAAKKAGKPLTSATSEMAEKGGKTVASKAVTAAVGQGALKVGLKAIPILGTLVGVGIDAVDGAMDTEGQKEAFGLGEDEEVSTRNKAEYTAANVLNMGGLVSGASGLLASGASWLGMDKTAEALTFDTGGMARGINGLVESGKNSIDAIVSGGASLLGLNKNSDSDKKQAEQREDERNKAVTDSIKAGATGTIAAIETIGKNLQNTFPPVVDANIDPVNGAGITRPLALGSAPDSNTVSPALNIGGKNSEVRSFRNNNFGNINFAGQEGAQLEKVNAKGERRFAKWNTPEEGFRGLGNQLMLYATGKSKHGKADNVSQILDIFAPANENNTQKYKADLAGALGVSQDQKLDLKNPHVMTKVMRAIATIEGGNPQVKDEFIRTAIGEYDFGSNKWVGKFNPETLAIVNEQRKKSGLSPISENDQNSFNGMANTAKGKEAEVPPAVSSAAPVTPASTLADTTPASTPADHVAPIAPTNSPEPEQHAQAAKKQPAANVEFPSASEAGTNPITALTDKVKSSEGMRHGSPATAGAPSTSKAATPITSEGNAVFSNAQLPESGLGILDSAVASMGDKVASAEGMRRPVTGAENAKTRAQRSQGSIAEAWKREEEAQKASEKSQQQAVSQVAYSHPKNLMSVTDLRTVPAANQIQTSQPDNKAGQQQAAAQAQLDAKMLAALNKIASLLDDMKENQKKEGNGRSTFVKNTAQPAPRAAIPLSFNDPAMANLANDN